MRACCSFRWRVLISAPEGLVGGMMMSVGFNRELYKVIAIFFRWLTNMKSYRYLSCHTFCAWRADHVLTMDQRKRLLSE